jgi:hypothetical protein
MNIYFVFFFFFSSLHRLHSSLNTIVIYDIETKTWSTGSAMLCNRHDLAIGCIAGLIYAVAGHDNRIYLNSVERYDRQTSTWSYVTCMTHARCALGVAVLEQRSFNVNTNVCFRYANEYRFV